MGRGSEACSFIKSTLFTYETPKMVLIESKLIGVIYRLAQLILFAIIIIWIFIMNNGYQFIDNGAVGGSTSSIGAAI